VNTQSSIAAELSDKQYRDAYVASQLRIGLPMQCRALRESRTWTQPKLAEVAGWSQPRISELERPGERKPNIETLLKLASAFDVALQVRFVPFSQFVDDSDHVDYDNFYIHPFAEDMARLQRMEEKMKSVRFIGSSATEAEAGDEQQNLMGLEGAANSAVPRNQERDNRENYSYIAS
jgi:transcriptional regulator with XRE-family HTH domain